MSEIRANTLKGEDGKAAVDFPGGITGVAGEVLENGVFYMEIWKF